MRLRLEDISVEKILENLTKLEKINWRPIVVVIAVSFVLATISSTIFVYFLIPKNQTLIKDSKVSTTPVEGSFSKKSKSSTIELEQKTLSSVELDTILKRNIFNSEGKLGDTDDSGKIEENVTPEVVKSQQPLKVQGIIYGGTPLSGIALIENTAKKSVNSFFVGDILIQDAKISEIYRDRVVFAFPNGRKEYIELEIKEPERTTRKRKGKVSEGGGDSGSVSAIATRPPPPKFEEEGFKRDTNEIEMSEGYRDRLLSSDFTKVLQDAKANPNFVDGQLQGFVLDRIRENSIYEKAGFQNGDVIEEINGVPLTDTAKTIQFLNTLRGEKEIDIRIKRGGAVVNKNLQIK